MSRDEMIRANAPRLITSLKALLDDLTIGAPEIVPAENLQAEQPTNPSRRGKLVVWALWALAIALVGGHPFWTAAGMPVPAFLSPVMEMLN